MMRELRPELPALKRIYVLGDDVPGDMDSFDALLRTPWEAQENVTALHARQVNPNALAEIIFTSGTTGEPKGVMHTHNTILCPILRLIERLQLTAQEVVLMASTFAIRRAICMSGTCQPCWGHRGIWTSGSPPAP
jgi:acyl-coenzyme A synthetase/AMP-(fatty) acid ligase